MLKFVRHGIVCITCLIIWMHGVVPHVHAHELSEEQHQAIHTSEPKDVLSIFSFIFHEYTEVGAFEHIRLNAPETLVFTIDQEDFYCVPALGIASGVLQPLRIECTIWFPEVSPIVRRKFRLVTAVRPPPLK